METNLFTTSGRGLIVDQLVQAGTFKVDRRMVGANDHKGDVDIESGIKTKEVKEAAKVRNGGGKAGRKTGKEGRNER